MNKVLINLKNSFVRRSRFEQISDTSRDHDDSLLKRTRVKDCDR